MASRLFIHRATAFLRRFSTVSEAVDLFAGIPKRESLYTKLSKLKIKPNSDNNIKVIIDEWFAEKPFKRSDISNHINFFRSRNNYNVAIQLSDWLESKVSLNNSDQAIRIDLLAKTRGIDSAEMYFNSLEGSAKTTKTYGALLNCYCKDKLLDKAVELFTELKQLKCTSTLNYNNMLSLYVNTKQYEQVPLLVEEMKQNRLKLDMFTYNMLINSYAAQNDFDAVEKVLEDMKEKGVNCDWFTYGNLATIHINAGSRDKATGFIQSMEKLMVNMRDQQYFHTLIALYRDLSDLPGVYRSWEALKSVDRSPTNTRKSVDRSPTNTSYLTMLMALSKLGDVEGLEKCYREWEYRFSLYDVRVTNVILESYLQRDMIKEANALFESIVEKGKEPNLRTLDMLAHYHIKNSEIDPALDYLKVGAAKVKPNHVKWFPSDEVIQLFLKYFKEQDDANGAEKFCCLMKKFDRLDPSVFESVLYPEVSSQQVEA